MKISKKQIKPGIIVLELTGQIHMGDDCQQIGLEFEEFLRQNEKRVIFDLSGIDHIDSAGIGKIVACFTRLKKSGGTLRLAGVKGMVEGVLKLTQVQKVIGIYPTALAASENFPLPTENIPAKN